MFLKPFSVSMLTIDLRFLTFYNSCLFSLGISFNARLEYFIATKGLVTHKLLFRWEVVGLIPLVTSSQ